MVRFLIFIAFVSFAEAKKGFDGIATMSVSDFKCLKSHGYDFFIARAWKSYGDYDNEGVQNVKHAREGKFGRI